MHVHRHTHSYTHTHGGSPSARLEPFGILLKGTLVLPVSSSREIEPATLLLLPWHRLQANVTGEDACMRAHAHTHTHTYTYTHTHTNTQTQAHTQARTHTHTHTLC